MKKFNLNEVIASTLVGKTISAQPNNSEEYFGRKIKSAKATSLDYGENEGIFITMENHTGFDNYLMIYADQDFLVED